MPYIMVDVESDGPIPGDYSMISFGAVLVHENLDKTFYGELKPISDKFIPEALSVSGFTRDQTLKFEDPKITIVRFNNWINSLNVENPIFISDNNGYDWMFMCWYFHHFINENPFGYSSQNLGSIYKGIVNDSSKSFKHLRKTTHSHNPLEDAIGNAQAFITIIKENNYKINL